MSEYYLGTNSEDDKVMQQCRKYDLDTWGLRYHLRKRLLYRLRRGFFRMSVGELENECKRRKLAFSKTDPTADPLYVLVKERSAWNRFKPEELKKECKKRRLAQGGSDEELRGRLINYERGSLARLYSRFPQLADTHMLSDLSQRRWKEPADANYSDQSEDDLEKPIDKARGRRLHRQARALDLGAAAEPVLTGLPGVEGEEFNQFNVTGDGSCLWRAFARAHLGDQERWSEARGNAQQMWNNAIDEGRSINRQRFELYVLMSDESMVNKEMKEGSTGTPLQEQLFGDDYGEVEMLQFLADWYHVEIIAFQRHWRNRSEDAKVADGWRVDREGGSWALGAIRGEPGRPQIFLANYASSIHWTALLPTNKKVRHNWDVGNDGFSYMRRPVFDEPRLPAAITRTEQHRHGSGPREKGLTYPEWEEGSEDEEP